MSKKWLWKILENYKGIGFIKEDDLFLFIANYFLLFVKKCGKKCFVLLATNLTKNTWPSKAKEYNELILNIS